MKVRHMIHLAATLVGVAVADRAGAVPTVSGRPVPELTDFDDIMTNYMDANGITAGVLGMVQNGRIVYLRGFGDDYDGNPLPENALFRVASLTKPLTAACIRQLVADPVNTNAFNLGQAGGGLLNCTGTGAPWPSLWTPPPATPNLTSTNTTVDHLLNHEGGWDHDTNNDGDQNDPADNPDMTYRETTIQTQMGLAALPARDQTMGYILGLPLQLVPGNGGPGSTQTYSNYNYLALGLIAEQASGQGLIPYLRQNVLTPAMWVPSTEVIRARTFRSWQDSREPYYDDPTLVTNVYNPGGKNVEQPYGGWDQEARLGQGGIACSAAAYLTFADNYRAGYTNRAIGQPLDTNPILAGTKPGHTGSFPGGTSSAITQRPDGYRIFVAFNKRNTAAGGTNFAGAVAGLVDTYLDNNVIPTINRTSDGFWTLPSGGVGPTTDFGGFDRPFHSFDDMVVNTESGSKIRLKPGTSGWTGTLKKRRRFDAPLGPATIGL